MAEKVTILVVEDDDDMSAALQVLLEHAGYEVLTATDAASGFAIAQQGKVNLILLDIMLPSGTEGLHFVWKLRREGNETAKNLPVIIVSGAHQKFPFKLYPEESDSVYHPGEYLPVQGFLDKPVQPTALLREIARLLESKATNA